MPYHPEAAKNVLQPCKDEFLYSKTIAIYVFIICNYFLLGLNVKDFVGGFGVVENKA
jgi:hypothetical protein